MIRIGIDTGGTFTDFVFFDGESIHTFKLSSTPANPERSILEGLRSYKEKNFEIIHGTTVSTNAFLQKKMAKTAFLCTGGFEHILYIGRQNRTQLFSLEAKKPNPIIPLSLCYGIDERTQKDGTVLRSPTREEITRIAQELKDENVQAVGIVFLHSYKNPQNEKFVAEILREYGFYITASHEILPEYREYERAVVTILNAALQPVITDYIDNLDLGIRGRRLSIIQTNGGILSPLQIIEEPIRTIMSGPAGGVIAARKIAGLTGETNLVTLDMGGTSTDVSMLKNGEITLTRDGFIEHLPLHFPIIDIATVGAGGGSIAWIDRGGVLQVGPESAGADPGPACYGESELPTVTDAFAVIGAIIPEMFLGGRMKLLPKRSVRAIKKIARQINKDFYETAEGIIRISVSAMERALRSVTLEKGEDPRYFTLMPFGGAGGLVAALLAPRLGIKKILVPPNPGVLSALGMLEADFKKESVHSLLKPVSSITKEELDTLFAEMAADAAQIIKAEGYPQPQTSLFLDMRYKGQSYELTIPYTDTFVQTFHQEHQQLYSYTLDDSDCEIVNLRVTASGKTPELKIEKRRKLQEEAKIFYRKEIYFGGQSQDFYIYKRSDLIPGSRVKVPAIIAAEDSTVIAPDNFDVEIDEYCNIILYANRK